MRPAPWQVEWNAPPPSTPASTCEAGAHRPGDEDGLAEWPEVVGELGVAGRQGTGGALAVHAQEPRLPVDVVVLELGQVVRDVVEQVELGVTERGGERLAGGDGEELAVGASVVRGRGHRTQVVAPLSRRHRRARQLRVGHGDAVARHGCLHDADVVGADLMAQTT